MNPDTFTPSSGPRVALVTGAGRGIGRAIALALREQGWQVVALGRPSAHFEALCAQAGIEALHAELSDARAAQAAAEAFRQRHGALHLLVNNAAIQQALVLDETARCEQIALEIATNLVAPAVLSAALLPTLRAGGGWIVNIGSVLALAPKTSAPLYCASKAGLLSLSQGLRLQLRGSGVRVMDVVPPLVDTDMAAGRGGARKIPPEAVAQALLSGLAAGRERVDVGPARAFRWLHRLVPPLAARLMANA